MLGVIEAVHDFSRPSDPTLLIDDPAVPSGSDPDKALVHVGRSVHVFVESATGVMVRGSLDDLVVGARIRACVGGAVLRSDPPRYTANRVDVLWTGRG